MIPKIRNILFSVLFILLSITIIGVFWLVTTPSAHVGLVFAYAAGLSMIFLPCTLPLVFVIVPLAMKKSPLKAVTMAVLFGLGLAITLSIYGALVAWAGNYIGMNKFIRFMFGIAGAAAFLFGLSELRLIVLRLPFASKVLPTSLQQSGDYAKAFFMGLFLGNAGVGCPNPAFYVLLTYIATLGDVGNGIALGVIHGLGRATPLIFLTILAILGYNTMGWVSRNQAKVERAMGWGLVGIGAYLFQYLPFGMAFWEQSIFHVAWNNLIQQAIPAIAESAEIEALLNIQGGTATVLPWVIFALMISAVIIWDAFVQKNKSMKGEENEA